MSKQITDEARLDMIEIVARGPGGLRLFADHEPDKTLALDIRGRTMREAIDTAFGAKARELMGAPHVMVTRALFDSAVASFVIAEKATLLPDTQGEDVEDLARLEVLTQQLSGRLWAFIGGDGA